MTWFKVDDTLASHRKARKAGLPAMGLWAVAGSLCSQQLSDGVVPLWFVSTWPQGKKFAAALVNANLWHVPGHDCPKCPAFEEGYLFHEWTERNPTAERVISDRERKVELRNGSLRQAVRERDGDRCRYCGRTVNWHDRRGVIGGTYDHVIPNLAGGIDNLVVACRGCNSSKRNRTPAEAGMPLRPEPGSRSGSRSDSETNLDRFQDGDLSRPDPTRPDPFKYLSGEGTSPNPPRARPPRTCPKHAGDPDPPNCGKCADARREHDLWQKPTDVPPPFDDVIRSMPGRDPDVAARGSAQARASIAAVRSAS